MLVGNKGKLIMQRVGLILATPAALIVLGWACLAQGADNRDGAQSAEAAQLVRQALAAEEKGDTERRASYLLQALAVAPDYAPAHWQRGEVRLEDRWLTVEAASAETNHAAKVSEYRQRRSQASQTASDQLKLANWCDEADLKDRARLHFMAALQAHPNNGQTREIIAKLSLVRYRKNYITAEQAELLKTQAKQFETAFRKWKPRLTRLRADLEGRDKAKQASAAKQLAEIDLEAIPALEAVFASSRPAAAKVAIEALAGLREQPATDSLVRHAIFAEHEEVREQAARALSSRDVFAYAPWLLASMSSPIEVQFQVARLEDGLPGERLSLYREGPLFDQSFVSRTVIDRRRPALTASEQDREVRGRAEAVAREANNTLRDASLAVAAIEENARSEFLNRRIADVLRVATGNDQLDADPKQWWDWWTDYNETHYSSAKPVYEIVRSQVIPAFRPSNSCFVAGTKVWTDTGPLAIESIRIGDCVLSKNVDTGELSYKLVTATTLGPPLPLVELRAGGETIQCTHGHLFWVSGSGWKMAKELKPGQWLHTAREPMRIESVEKKGMAACHNLIVPDFNTYFVSDRQILVHDINIRSPSLATVPGLIDP